jgi:hypothetical protein
VHPERAPSGDRMSAGTGGVDGEAKPKTRQWFEEGALWLALLLAFSPTLLGLADHWEARSWPRYSLAFLPLLIWSVRHDSAKRPLFREGLALIAVAVVGQFLASLAAVTFVARPLAAMAVIGLLLLRGLASPGTAMLALWIVPVPYMVIRDLGCDASAAALCSAAATLLSALGAPIAAVGNSLSVGEGRLSVASPWGGLVLLVHMTGLAWYLSRRRGLGYLATAGSLLAAAALALPIQWIAITLAGALLCAGSARTAGLVLDPGSWLAPLLAAVCLGERRPGRWL